MDLPNLSILSKINYTIAGSANGRPIDSGSINLGSNPSPAALEILDDL